MDVIVETRAKARRKRCCRTPLQCKAGIEQIHDFIHRSGIAVGSEIPAPVFFDDPCLDDPRVFLVGDSDVGIGLVIPQQDVVLGPVFFDEIAL